MRLVHVTWQYGTASSGGTNGGGTVFALNTDGTGFTNLHNFHYPGTLASDGGTPQSRLLLSGNTLYGITFAGGSQDSGVAFALNTDGTGYTNLQSFPGTTSATGLYTPFGGLVLADGILYGTATESGTGGGGVFGISANGMGLTNLYNFTGPDGSSPWGSLVLSGNTLYGTTAEGGAPQMGSVFAINTDGTGFTNLYSFTATSGTYPHYANDDGALPYAGLALSGNILYGTAQQGGTNGDGVVFAIDTDGTHFTVLHTFAGNDGAEPWGGLIVSGNTLYGTTSDGGTNGDGTVFSLHTDGSSFTNWYNFTGGADGANPNDDVLVLSGNTLYGTVFRGSTNGTGAVFSLTLPLPLVPVIAGLELSGTNLVINASASGAGTYELLASTNLSLSLSQWTPIATNILTASGNFSITNSVNPAMQQCLYILQAQ